MKKNIIILTIFAVSIIVLAGVSSAFVSVDPENVINQNKTSYYHRNKIY